MIFHKLISYNLCASNVNNVFFHSATDLKHLIESLVIYKLLADIQEMTFI